jgi:isoquinoline 1-oxidoreductase beta subunit
MLYATVRMNPNLGGPMRGFDATRAEGMTGVKEIIPLAGGVIVIATNTWYAFQVANAIDFDWGPAPYPEAIAEHKQQIGAALDNDNSLRTRNDGDVDGALTNAAVIEREYEVPYLAHATMEPLNAVAWLNGNRLDIWAGNQWPTSARLDSADLAGVSREAVHVHTTYMGGGFGRRLETDFIKVAVEAARAMAGTPVKVTWSREEDMTHDAYRPMAKARCRAALAGNRPRALDIQLAAPPLSGSHDYRSRGTYTDRPDVSIAMGAGYQPYDIENYRVTSHAAGQLLPVGWWRGVGESQNGFFVETFMDELAYAAGEDPMELRLALLKDATSRAVLQSVADMSNWGSALPEGHARGVAFFRSSGAPTAQVIEIRDTARGIELVKAFVAANVGIALDPRNLTGQLEGALIFGLTAAMFGEITVTDGRVDQTNFDQYDLLRIHQMPAIEVKIHEDGQRLFGVGEAATPTAAPALGNAIHALTGSRLRELPFDKFVRFA